MTDDIEEPFDLILSESPHHDPPLQRGRAQNPQELQSQRQQVIVARAASVTTNKLVLCSAPVFTGFYNHGEGPY